MEDTRIKTIRDILCFFNAVYPLIIVSYENDEFIITGDVEEAESCRQEIENIGDFAQFKNR
jgi:hypothetical protein